MWKVLLGSSLVLGALAWILAPRSWADDGAEGERPPILIPAGPGDRGGPEEEAVRGGLPLTEPPSVQAQSGSRPPAVLDVAFAAHVDPGFLRSALASLDPARLTDAALQVAEAERVLQRPCDVIAADRLFTLAVRAAVYDRDDGAVDRLRRAAAALPRKALAEALASSESVRRDDGHDRAAGPVLACMVRGASGAEGASETSALLALSALTRRAHLLGDGELLARASNALDEARRRGFLRPCLVDHLVDRIAHARSSATATGDLAVTCSRALQALAQASASDEAAGELTESGPHRSLSARVDDPLFLPSEPPYGGWAESHDMRGIDGWEGATTSPTFPGPADDPSTRSIAPYDGEDDVTSPTFPGPVYEPLTRGLSPYDGELPTGPTFPGPSDDPSTRSIAPYGGEDDVTSPTFPGPVYEPLTRGLSPYDGGVPTGRTFPGPGDVAGNRSLTPDYGEDEIVDPEEGPWAPGGGPFDEPPLTTFPRPRPGDPWGAWRGIEAAQLEGAWNDAEQGDEGTSRSGSAARAKRTVDGMRRRALAALRARIEDTLQDAAPGNQGTAALTGLDLDLSTMDLRVEGWIRARHSWGRLNAPTLSNPGRMVDVAVQHTVGFRASYNLGTRELRGKARLWEGTLRGPLGYEKHMRIEVDLDGLQRLLSGDFWALIEMIPNPSPDVLRRQHRNEYLRIRGRLEARHGTQNVYFASPRFVKWATPERLVRWGAEAIVNPSAARHIMADVRRESMKEVDAVAGWLQARTQMAGPEVLAMARSLLQGQAVRLPSLSLHWQTVKYESRLVAFGRYAHAWVPVRHAAFCLVWHPGS